MFFRTGFVGRQFPAGSGLASGAPALDINLGAATLDSRIIYARAGTATDGSWLDAPGTTYNTYATNVPRINSKGLLVEFGSTNFILNSDAPATQTVSLAAGGNYCLWVIGTGSAAVTAGTAVITGAGTATAGTYVLFNVTTAGTVTVTVTGSLTRFQLEESPAARYGPSSYIPTTGASAVRNIDSAYLALPAPWFNPNAYSFVAETGEPPLNVGGGNALTMGEVYNSSANRLYVGYSGTIGVGVVVSQFTDNYPISNTSLLKAGMSIQTSGPTSISCVNGATPQTHAGGFVLFDQTTATQFSLSGIGGSIVPMNMRIKRLRFWTRALAAAELQAATTVVEPTVDLNFMVPGTLDPSLTFSRGSVATYFNNTGTMQTVSGNTPRWDYDPVALTLRGLLIEEARTNGIPSSANFAVSGWSINGATGTGGQAGAPDGTSAYTRLAETVPAAPHYAGIGVSGLTASTSYTLSVFAQAAQNRYLQLALDDGSSNGAFAIFDVQAGTITQALFAIGSAVIGTASIQSVGGGSFRCAITTTIGAATTGRIGITLSNAGTNGFYPSYAGNAANGLLIWGAQLEAGTFPTSYIPTTGAAVTRAGDACNLTLLGAWFDATHGTLAIDYDSTKSTGNCVAGGFTDGTFGNTLYGSAALPTPSLLWAAPSAGRTVGTASLNPLGSINKVACAYTAGAIAACTNGAAVDSTTLGAGPFPWTAKLVIGDSPWGAGNQVDGHIRRARYWPRVLSNAELQSVTT